MKKQDHFSLTDTIDRLLCRPAFGIPFFFAVLSLVFFLSFRGLGGTLSTLLESALFRWCTRASHSLLYFGVSEYAVRYLIDGICTAIASALAFLPQTVVFFVLIRALDDCGYLARAIFVTDRFFRTFGLSGNAVIPLLLGYGCAASSVSVCTSEPKERNAVIRVLPFVPCSARLPVILFLADSFFPKHKTLVFLLIFALSFVLIFFSFLLSSDRKEKVPSLITALPDYRLPSPKALLAEATCKSREYLFRTVTAVLISCAAFSALAMLTPSLSPTEDPSQSLLYAVCDKISPVFGPLGFDCPEMTAALIFGFFAKENIIGVLGTMAKCAPVTVISPPSAAAFTVFSTFYAPCIFLFSAEVKRSGTAKALRFLWQNLLMAYAIALAVRIFANLLPACC